MKVAVNPLTTTPRKDYAHSIYDIPVCQVLTAKKFCANLYTGFIYLLKF